MSSVGLSFGSATSGQGFNVSSTVSQIMTSMQAVETPWNTSLTSLEAQDTVISSLGTQLSTLTTDLQNLTDFDGAFSGMEGSSSDTNVVELTSASTTAVAGTHTVVVSKLAQTSTEVSGQVASTDALSGSLQITVGASGTPQTVTVDSSNPTLSDFAATINAAGIGVQASVINEASGQVMELVSQTSGSAGQLSVTGSLTDTTTSKTVNYTSAQSGQDAELTVDGISLTSSSNTVTTAIPGVTMQLVSAAPSESVQVQVVNNTSGVTTALQTFVDDYNTLITAVNTQEGNTASGTPEPLDATPVLAQLQSELENGISTAAGAGNITSFYDLGITMNNDGTLSLDTDTLSTALNTNYSDAMNFFQNTGEFGQTYLSTLGDLGTTNPDGALALQSSENSSQESTLKTDISNENALISTQQTNLTAELNSANETLQEIPSQLEYVNELYSAITGYNTGTSS
jgi:flagellar hook-associated protein 2